jgi:glycosyltransferase involved in cell wall biosynthesis
MACGTPVIAFNRGSVPEVVDEGATGFVVEDEIGAVGAVDRLSQLSRERIRERFEERFTARRMALDYLAAYRGLIEGGLLAAATGCLQGLLGPVSLSGPCNY